jgi:peptidoglycan/xylan/chitin deacetylase (PgdA/CDA1 family)
MTRCPTAATLATTLWGTYAPNAQLFGSVVGRGPDEAVVYLTFDDGPNERVTDRILDGLAFEGVPATFFMVESTSRSIPTPHWPSCKQATRSETIRIPM